METMLNTISLFLSEPGCVSVEMGSHVFDLELQIGLGSLGRALEGHVLQEVGNAVVLRGLVSEIKHPTSEIVLFYNDNGKNMT
jgi:hypothetical protein